MSNTVSVETARRLKAAGLVWQPKEGDCCHFDSELRFDKGQYVVLEVSPPKSVYMANARRPIGPISYNHYWCTWLPTAGDLWRILADGLTSLHLETHDRGVRLRCIWRSDLWRGNDIEDNFQGRLEEALGEAVIEMLERGKQGVG